MWLVTLPADYPHPRFRARQRRVRPPVTGTLQKRAQPVIFDVVSSLWTPDGEHKIERQPSDRGTEPEQVSRTDGGGSAGPRVSRGSASEPDGPEIEEADLDEVRRQLLEAPVEVVLANHAYGLFELAALHLSSKPPNLSQSRLAIDALGALVEGLGDRLGQVEAPLKEALAQIRLAYVQISEAPEIDGERSA